MADRLPLEAVLLVGSPGGERIAEAIPELLEAAGARLRLRHRAVAAAPEGGFEPAPADVQAIVEAGAALVAVRGGPDAGGRRARVDLARRLDLFLDVAPHRGRAVNARGRTVDVDVLVLGDAAHHPGLMPGFGPDDEAVPELRRLAATPEAAVPAGAAVTVHLRSPAATRRALDAAADCARRHGRRTLTVVHKANALKATDGLLYRAAREVPAEAGVRVETVIVDHMCAELVQRPEAYEAIFAPALYVDALDGVLSGLLGAVPPARLALGDAVGVSRTEPALDDAGQVVAALAGAALLLRQHDQGEAAARLERACRAASVDGGPPSDLAAAVRALRHAL